VGVLNKLGIGTGYASKSLCSGNCPAPTNKGEELMIAHRRTWFYRLAGQKFAHAITFKIPVTATMVRDSLRKTVGPPLELWGRSAQ
jgi:hypothetical protein